MDGRWQAVAAAGSSVGLIPAGLAAITRPG